MGIGLVLVVVEESGESRFEMLSPCSREKQT